MPSGLGSTRASRKLGSLSLASSDHFHAPRPGGRRFPPPPGSAPLHRRPPRRPPPAAKRLRAPACGIVFRASHHASGPHHDYGTDLLSRAIVSDLAGTTRDTIEEVVNLHGIPLRLVDTAGVREATDRIEAEGIQRTVRQIEAADLLLEIADASKPRPSDAVLPATAAKHLLVLNKTDLGEHPSWSEMVAVRISCTRDEGFDALSDAIRDSLHFSEADWGEHAVAINARHQASLQLARTSLHAALELLNDLSSDPELAAIDLREALDALGEIPGKVDTEDLLGVIFSSFCIGK